ncbi:peptidyl-prolyl cis-trans isomerase [bacterium]|nr:peptidyl-prolyl cis-trans isomerase [bacterium]
MSNPSVIIETNKGTMEAELWADKAPESVKNFLAYTDEKFFDNTVFHRVIPSFMIQGGGFTADMKQKQTKAAIKNEATSELKNVRGTLAMARTMDINSATSQFFINLVDNDFLNHTGTGMQTYGYAVFGKLTKGLDVLDAIAKVPTGSSGPHENVPKEAVVILSIRKK